jgi:dipeptidyl aminopeptidase/acylaminoacyl peptidase
MQQQIHNNINKSELIVFENLKHNLLVEDNTKKILMILEKFLKKQVID